jgi:chloramphenicol-sensitive protein RarD
MGLATGCYLLWGLVPIYWKAITEITATEVLIPRILWTLVLLAVAAAVSGRLHETRGADRRTWGWNALAAFFLSANWGIFVWAVQTDQVIATSLGYYINPLMSILLGLLILGERLNRIQGAAVVIAALGVATLTIRAGKLPWISLLLASSFALYGLIHKMRPQPPLAGLMREMMVLSPLCLLGLLWLARAGSNSSLVDADVGMHAYLSLTSVVTAGPLLLFHAATKRLPLVAVGMFQYIAPTITLLLATLVWNEPFTQAHAAGFGFVWLGLVIFTADSVRRASAQRERLVPLAGDLPLAPDGEH